MTRENLTGSFLNEEMGIYKIKIIQPNIMILVSFSSGEDALSNDVKYITLLARKVLKIRRSAFFLGGHQLYIDSLR